MKALRIAVAAVLVLGLAIGATGCSEDNVAARVNGEVITIEDLDAQVATLQEQYPDMFTGADGEGRLLEFKQRLLDNMINNVLIKQAAEERGIEVSDDEIATEIENLKSGFQSDEQFEQVLAQSGMDVAALEDQVREGLMTDRLIQSLSDDMEISDEDIQAYYDANEDQFHEDAAVRASHILFNPEDKELAEDVLQQIKDGGDFAALATEYSQDPGSAANGGDLGWPNTPYVPEFQEAAEALEPGEVSDLVETTFGWHIIKVVEKRDDRQKPLDEVRDQIEQILVQQHNAELYQQFLNDLKNEAEIEILVPELATPAVSTDAPGDGTEEPAEEPAE